jgi:hypothetical protein
MTTHARDVALAVLLAAAIVAAAVYGYATLRQNAMPIVARNCRLPKRCFPGDQAIPKRIVRVSDAPAGPSSPYNQDYARVHVRPADVEARMRRRMGGRFAKAYDALPRSKRLAVLRYYEAYDKGGVILAEGVRETDNLCRLIEPNDRLLLSADQPLKTDFLKPSFGTFQTWWLAAVPNHPVFLQTLNAIVHDVENRGGAKARTDEHAFTVVVERLENQGMRDHRIVCPDANGVLAR